MVALPALLRVLNVTVPLLTMAALPAVPLLKITKLLLVMLALPPRTEIPPPLKVSTWALVNV